MQQVNRPLYKVYYGITGKWYTFNENNKHRAYNMVQICKDCNKHYELIIVEPKKKANNQQLSFFDNNNNLIKV